MTPLHTIREASAWLRVSRRTVARMLADGTLRGCRVRGQWRFTEAQLRAAVEMPAVRPSAMVRAMRPPVHFAPSAQREIERRQRQAERRTCL